MSSSKSNFGNKNIRVIRATLMEMFKRETKYNESKDYYDNGITNDYPLEIERAITNSPTATRATVMKTKFIAGQGVDIEDIIINAKKELKLTDLIKATGSDLSWHGGVFIHVNFAMVEGVVKPNSYDVLDYSKCRISKEDGDGNKGMILYKDFNVESTGYRNKSANVKEVKFFPFHSDTKVRLARIKSETKAEDLATGIKRYKGEVYYLNMTPRYVYALSPFDSSYNDCDTEYRIGLYTNTMCRGGFLGKTAVLTQGLDDEVSDTIVKDIKQWLGAENSSSIYHLDVESTESLDNVLKILQVESQFDDAMFENTIKRIRRNILGCANNIPEPLVFAGDGNLFGTSGTAYFELKKFYNEQTHEERNLIERTLNLLGIEKFEITPLSDVEVVKVEEVKKEA